MAHTIEKGIDASIFMKEWALHGRVFRCEFGFLIDRKQGWNFLALLITTYTSLDDDAVYPSIIFIMAGVGLLSGFRTGF